MSTNRKTATMKLKGNDYAQVKDRLQEFWSDCPRGKIVPTPTIGADGRVTHFSVYILKDKANPASAEATGHSFAKAADMEKEKYEEKLETVAVGRALALLGYGADGAIASAEEMEAFNEEKEKATELSLEEWKKKLESCKTVKQLSDMWPSVPAKLKQPLNKTKDDLKAILTTEAHG